MASAGDLTILPPELRKQIYSALLVEGKKIGIMKYGSMLSGEVARMDNHINPRHRGQVYDTRMRQWIAAPCSTTALLHVNRAIGEEAKQVLYGCNHFEFQHSGALLSFLETISKCAKFLQHIAIIGNGILQKFKWEEMDLALGHLTRFGALRSLEVSHLAICGKSNLQRRLCHRVEIEELVRHFSGLLRAVELEFRKADLKMKAYDVVKITLPPCSQTIDGVHAHGHFWIDGPPLRRIPITKRSRSARGQKLSYQCTCLCSQAERKNEWFAQELKEEIARQLGLGLDDE